MLISIGPEPLSNTALTTISVDVFSRQTLRCRRDWYTYPEMRNSMGWYW